MSSTTSTKTMQITKEITIGPKTYEIVITKHSSPKPTPYTIYINQIETTQQPMGDYIYTIADSSTYLNRTSQDDQLRLLNQYLVKKLDSPVYLAVSHGAQFDNVAMFREIVALV